MAIIEIMMKKNKHVWVSAIFSFCSFCCVFITSCRNVLSTPTPLAESESSPIQSDAKIIDSTNSPTPTRITPSPTYTKTPIPTITNTPSCTPTEQLTKLEFRAINDFRPNSGSGIVIDFDSDGDLDLVVPQFLWPPAPSSVVAFKNYQLGKFIEASNSVFNAKATMTENGYDWVVADFNGDGREDLFIADSGPDESPFIGGQSQILIQNDEGQLINETFTRIPLERAFTHSVSGGDIDGDNDIDLFIGNIWGKDEVGPKIYINNGEGIFHPETNRIPYNIYKLQQKYTSSLFLDANGDGYLDLILGGHSGTYPSETFERDAILLNDGKGFFAFAAEETLPPRIGGPNAGTVAMNVADFNQDGFVDLIMSTHIDYSDPILQLLLNNGNGSFRDETSLIEQDWLPHYTWPWGESEHHWIVQPTVIDYNHDGWPDILAVGSGLESILFENKNGSLFLPKVVFPQFDSSGSVLMGIIPEDFNDDKITDLVLIYHGKTQMIYFGPFEGLD